MCSSDLRVSDGGRCRLRRGVSDSGDQQERGDGQAQAEAEKADWTVHAATEVLLWAHF